MDHTDAIKQVYEFNKTAFNNAYETIVKFQDEAEKGFTEIVGQAPMFPEEGRKFITTWSETYKQGRDTIKESIDEGFKRYEDFIYG